MRHVRAIVRCICERAAELHVQTGAMHLVCIYTAYGAGLWNDIAETMEIEFFRSTSRCKIMFARCDGEKDREEPIRVCFREFRIIRRTSGKVK